MTKNTSKIFAKSLKYSNSDEILLSDHTNDLLKALESLKIQIKSEKLYNLIKLAIQIHDFGKVLPYYQLRIAKNSKYLPFDHINIPHSFFSILWINKSELKNYLMKIEGINEKNVEDYKNFVLSAVAYHHWRENFSDLISFNSNNFERLYEKFHTNKEILTQNLLTNIENIYGIEKT